MEKHDYLPYHQSLVKFLEIIEKAVTNNSFEYRTSAICRFRIQSGSLLIHAQLVEIPEKEINNTAVGLLSFYKNFMDRHESLMEGAASISDEDEKRIISDHFMDTVSELISRPSAHPEIPELETTNWFDVPDDQSDEAMGLRLAGQFLLHNGFPSEWITTLCRKAAWFIKNDGDIRSSAMEKVLKIECPNFFKQHGRLFIKSWTWPLELTGQELAEVMIK